MSISKKSQLIAGVKFIAYFSLAKFKHKSGLKFKLAPMFSKYNMHQKYKEHIPKLPEYSYFLVPWNLSYLQLSNNNLASKLAQQ